jgi:glycosyltransferase involved in cell wall biosynthesis
MENHVSTENTKAPKGLKKILIVGPLPPPIGGSPLTLQVMLAELENYPDIVVTVINTSPLRHVSKKMTGFNFEKVKRMFTILSKFRREIRDAHVVLVFANDLFAFILVPLLLWCAKRYKKPLYLKPVGSGLDLFMEAHGKIIKLIMLKVLKSMDGILTQTQYLAKWLNEKGCENAFYLPGFRSYQSVQANERQTNEEFRLIDLAHITVLKGPIILLEALQIITKRGGPQVRCDFYGPIHDDIRDKFNNTLKNVTGAKYMGVADAGKGSETIALYDVLVLPTCYDTEGHPGVLIEAMHAGVPIISTQIRTLPELVDHGVNGLLVPVGDSEALADAIEQLALDSDLRKQMGKANFKKGYEFRSDVVVQKMVNILFPEVKEFGESAP